MWEYVKGSEVDFDGAPDWAVYLAEVLTCGKRVRAWEAADNKKYTCISGCHASEVGKIFEDGFLNWIWSNKPIIIAERRKVDDLQSRTNDANLGEALKEMLKDVPGTKIDVPPDANFDTVQRPAHYNQSGIECIDAIAASMSAEEFQAYLKGNVQKYLWRYQHKNGLEDVKKAEWYLNRLVKELSK